MKKILFVVLISFSMVTFAQKEKNYRGFDSDFTPEQRATLKTKKMALDLDLNDNQQSQILKLNNKWSLEREKQRKQFQRKDQEEVSSTEKFNRMNTMLDMQMDHQQELKKVLNANQYETWKKSRNNIKNRQFNRSGQHQRKGR